MFDKENFRKHQELGSTGYAVKYAHRELDESCLVIMRFLKLRGVRSIERTPEEFAKQMDWTEELEIAREFYDGIMSIARGKKLYHNYSRKILDCGYRSKSFIKPESLDEWAEEYAFDAVKHILTTYTEWLKRQGEE